MTQPLWDVLKGERKLMVQPVKNSSATPTRIVFADDSAAVRRLLTDGMDVHADFQVVGSARNGQEAVDMVNRLRPDVVMLDVEMPVMDGIDATRAIRRTNPTIPILMFSSLTRRGGEATLDALSAGANDYIPKPTSTSSVGQVKDYLNAHVFPKLQAMALRKSQGPAFRVKQESFEEPPAPKCGLPPEAVVIGSSTGGPNALAAVLSEFPAAFNVPIFIVQHMPAMFTSLLAARLQQITPFNVAEAKQGDRPKAGEVYIAPGDQHMEVERTRLGLSIKLHRGPEENSCRPAVDVLFRSAAQTFGDRTLAVVLTGMGRDGVKGCELLHQRGARIFVQDEESSVIWGMPRAVNEAGYADQVLPLTEIPRAIRQTLSSAGKLPPSRLTCQITHS